MLARQLWGVPVALGLLVALGCGESEPGGDSAAGAGQVSGATSNSGSGGKSGSAGSGAATSGGSTSGGSAAESGTGGRPGGIAGQAMGGREPGEGGADSGPPDGLYDCDTRKVMCRRAPPVCDTFEVPAIEGTCYGECVKIDLCACSNADQCPDANQYTCWMSTHCGPYVQ
jgi:hypothetical protein